jgi:hypothetical protein
MLGAQDNDQVVKNMAMHSYHVIDPFSAAGYGDLDQDSQGSECW